ncbi:GAF domain-containing protein (plasmid) [Arthrobacter agilis]|uniref:GAF domain-containing protein n=1 Tax=Arthrobacter agilis TaxID=37921 RepID=UPI0023669B3A|nr:GAF domain-containing protein [Arthrobacter agilis]WDF35089.1 GAF domain-containing protein [Arthrobacter agilis]
MNGQVQIRLTALALSTASITVSELWVRYYALGGRVSEFEVQAYLGGLLVLPGDERNLLADATNELLEGTSVNIRIPHGEEDEADETPGDSRRSLGALGAFLFTAEEAEEERLDAVTRTNLLDSPAEERFDQYTQQAREYFNVSSSIVALIDDRRMFLKSVIGPIEQNLPREITFCTATIRNAGPLIIPDTLEDDRFRTNPLVLGEPFIRFYAGYPLRGPGGWTVGTLCVIDQEPRGFSPQDGRFLRKLARLVEDEINA